jgi:hypothetical protein
MYRPENEKLRGRKRKFTIHLYSDGREDYKQYGSIGNSMSKIVTQLTLVWRPGSSSGLALAGT